MTHTQLLKVMKQLGYQINESGMCYGVVHMALQAMLLGDSESYNRRLKLMDEIGLKNIAHEIEFVRRKITNERKGTSVDMHFMLTERASDLLEISAFFEGVAMHYQPGKYPNYFEEGKAPIADEQNVEASFPLVLPRYFGRRNVEKIDKFTGVYDHADLTNYFHLIREALLKQDVKRTVGISFTSSRHIVMVSFNPIMKTWEWNNSGEIEEVHDEAALARKVLSALSKNEFTAALSEIYMINKLNEMGQVIAAAQDEQVQAAFKDLKDNPLWQGIHAVTGTNARRADSYGASWLYLATHCGDIPLMQQLLENGADANRKTTDSGLTPLLRAANDGNVEAIRCLHAKGARPDQKMLGVEMTELALAAEGGHVEAVEYLLTQMRADPNIGHSKTGVTPLHYATLMGHVQVVKSLVEGGATVNAPAIGSLSALLAVADQKQKKSEMEAVIKEKNHGKLPADIIGVTPLHAMALQGNIEGVKFLLERGATHTHANGLLPRDLAYAMGHTAIVEALDQHNMKQQQLEQPTCPLMEDILKNIQQEISDKHWNKKAAFSKCPKGIAQIRRLLKSANNPDEAITKIKEIASARLKIQPKFLFFRLRSQSVDDLYRRLCNPEKNFTTVAMSYQKPDPKAR